MVRPLDVLCVDDHNRHGIPVAPCKQSLLFSSWVRKRKRGSASITCSLWGRRSLNFWTRQSCFPSSNFWVQAFVHWFVPVANASSQLLDLCPKLCLISNMLRMLNKDLTWFMQSFWISEQANLKEKLCWQDDPVLPGDAKAVFAMLILCSRCMDTVNHAIFFLFLSFFSSGTYSWLKLTARRCNFVY